MSPKMEEITRELRALGASPAVLKLVVKSVHEEEAAPPITNSIIKKMRATASIDRRAMLVWCSNGKYKVFSAEGHEALRESATKHKPWKFMKRAKKLKN